MPNDPTEPEVRTVNEIFSDYVLRLSTGGEPPDAASYLAVCEALRVLLVRELHRRGLWRAPPSHVGLTGSDWSQGALEDLVSEAYAFIFLRRLEGLKNQQRTKPDKNRSSQ